MNSFHSILTTEMQRLCVTAADRIRLTALIKEVEDTLDRYEKENNTRDISPKQLLWERKMLDLSFRNNLLNMKVGKKVAPFMPCPIETLEDLLADGSEYELNPDVIDTKTARSLYRTARTMRDREIVQPSVLKRLGWNIMHLWSIDWFVNPDIVIKNIVSRIHKQ